MTLALTYGSKVDWYRNVVAAGGCRIRMGQSWLALGPPRTITTEEGLRRMPAFARPILGAVHVTEFVELDVLGERPVR